MKLEEFKDSYPRFKNFTILGKITIFPPLVILVTILCVIIFVVDPLTDWLLKFTRFMGYNPDIGRMFSKFFRRIRRLFVR